MLTKNIIKSITRALVVSSLFCGIAFSSQSKFNAYTDKSITSDYRENSILRELTLDSQEGGNRLQYGETKIESGPAFCPTLNFNEFYDKAYINTVNLLVQNSEAENIMKLLKFYNSDSDLEKIKSDNEKVQKILNSYPDVVNNIINEQQKFHKCYDSKNRTIIDPPGKDTYSYFRQRRELIYSAIARLIKTAYTQPLKHFEEQMKDFYTYLTKHYYTVQSSKNRRSRPATLNDSKAPAFNSGSRSATHTEFIMVYYIIKNDEGILKKFNNFTNMLTSTPERCEDAFHELINNLGPKLPNRIYSAHCMCPVCEAFLTSLYNVCKHHGEFISILSRYKSISGPYGKLTKLLLGDDTGQNTVANGKGAAGSSARHSFGAPASKERGDGGVQQTPPPQSSSTATNREAFSKQLRERVNGSGTSTQSPSTKDNRNSNAHHRGEDTDAESFSPAKLFNNPQKNKRNKHHKSQSLPAKRQ